MSRRMFRATKQFLRPSVILPLSAYTNFGQLNIFHEQNMFSGCFSQRKWKGSSEKPNLWRRVSSGSMSLSHCPESLVWTLPLSLNLPQYHRQLNPWWNCLEPCSSGRLELRIVGLKEARINTIFSTTLLKLYHLLKRLWRSFLLKWLGLKRSLRRNKTVFVSFSYCETFKAFSWRRNRNAFSVRTAVHLLWWMCSPEKLPRLSAYHPVSEMEIRFIVQLRVA